MQVSENRQKRCNPAVPHRFIIPDIYNIMMAVAPLSPLGIITYLEEVWGKNCLICPNDGLLQNVETLGLHEIMMMMDNITDTRVCKKKSSQYARLYNSNLLMLRWSLAWRFLLQHIPGPTQICHPSSCRTDRRGKENEFKQLKKKRKDGRKHRKQTNECKRDWRIAESSNRRKLHSTPMLARQGGAGHKRQELNMDTTFK